MQFVLFQSSEGTQTHIDNFAGLDFVEVETYHQVVHRFLWTFSSTDDVYHLVDVVAGYDETLQNV